MIHGLFLEELSLWTWFWQSTLFVLIGLVGSFLLRRRPARACQGLFLAMVGAVALPLMSAAVAHFGIGMLAPEPIAHEPEITYQFLTMDDEAPAALFPPDVQMNMEPAEIQAVAPPEKPVVIKAAPQSVRIPWRSILLVGWMTATFLLLGRLLVAFISGICLLRRAKSRGCGQIQRAANSARARLGIVDDLRIRSRKNVHSPMIWCWSRPPVLLVPGNLEDKVDWEDVICHELAHWRRRDYVIGLMAELAVCILPWNPFLWWAKRRVVRLSEQACDDWVLAGGCVGADYAQSLLNLSPKGQMAFLPTMIGKEKPMKERIYRIVKAKCGNPRIGMRWALAMTLIAATLTIGIAFAQRQPERFEPPDRDRWRAEEERERRMLSEHRAELEDKARQMEAWIVQTEKKLAELEESGKGEGDQAQALRAELREMHEGMSRIERELRGFEVERREREKRPPWEVQEERRETLRRLEELGRAMAIELERLEAQQPGRSEEANALHRRMRELNEQMREVQQALRRQLQDPERRRPQLEGREHPEIDRHIQELVRHLEELKMNARDKERALKELEEQGKGETEDAHVVRRKLDEIHERMQQVKEELGDIERERMRARESKPIIQYGRVPAPEAMMREREELGAEAHRIEIELRELGGEHPEHTAFLERKLHEIHKRIEQIDREQGRFGRPQPHVEELHIRQEHLRAQMQEIEHVLLELNEQGKGEGEKAQRLGRELRAIQEQLEATERELQGALREEPRERGRDDLEREVQELHMQVNNVNEQLGEMRDLLMQLLKERDERE